MKQIQGKQGLVRDIGRFGKPRVREIGIPLYININNHFKIPKVVPDIGLSHHGRFVAEGW